jgi:hypothetical protein
MDPRIRIHPRMSWIRNNALLLYFCGPFLTFWILRGSGSTDLTESGSGQTLLNTHSPHLVRPFHIILLNPLPMRGRLLELKTQLGGGGGRLERC